MRIRASDLFKLCAVFLLMSTQVWAQDLHDLARENRWYSLLKELSKLSDEKRTSALNKSIFGQTVLDIVDQRVGNEHSIYLELVQQGALHGFGIGNEAEDEAKKENKLKRSGPLTLSDPTDADMGLEGILPSFAFGDMTLQVNTNDASKSNNKKQTTLTIEEGKKAIRDKIEIQTNSKELEARKAYLLSEKVRQRAINVLKAMQEANGSQCFSYRLNDGTGFEVVCFYSDDEYEVYVIYPDLTVGKGGTGGTVTFVQHLSHSSHDEDIILVGKKTPRTKNMESIFQSEAEFAERVGLCIAAPVTEASFCMFLVYGGITFADLPLDLPDSLRNQIAFQALKAISALHAEGIVHGDVKPRNFLVRIRPDGSVAVSLCDMGEARFECEITDSDKPRDTPAYRAPEGGRYSYHSESWAIAIIMLMLLEPNYDMDNFQADKPFDAPNLHSDLAIAFPHILLLSLEELERMKEEDPFRFELIQFIHRLTHVDPTQRPTPAEIKLMIEYWEKLYAEKMPELPRRKFSISRKGVTIPRFGAIKHSKSVEPDKSPKSGRGKSPKQPSPKQTSPKQQSSTQSVVQTNNNNSPPSKPLQSSLPDFRSQSPAKPLQTSSPDVLISSKKRKDANGKMKSSS